MNDDGTPGKKPPPASAASRQPTLVLRRRAGRHGIERHNPELWAEDDYAGVGPETD